MTIEEGQAIISACTFPDYTIELIRGDQYDYIQARYMEADTVTGKIEEQKTRRWVLDASDGNGKITKEIIVGTAFKCCMTSVEHRTREWFLYNNRAIYQPHYTVDTLWNACEDRTT